MVSKRNLGKILAFTLIMILTVGFVLSPTRTVLAADTGVGIRQDTQSDDRQMRGIWLSCFEYADLGLTIAEDEETYRANADRFLMEAEKYGINAVFLHARAFDDAFWKSRTFKASVYAGGDVDLTAWDAYDKYDPFGVFLEEAHQYGMEVHAWLNPYRVSQDYYYDPADTASTRRVLKAVNELLALESNGEKIDGIHMDDYFYHACEGYFKISDPDEKYVISGSEEESPRSWDHKVVTPAEKRANVNRMVKIIYRTVHRAGRIFGISPAGNYDNDMNAGADVDTWLSEEGYVDYLIPQIYWTNQWGGNGNITMFSDRLDLFLDKWKNNARLYVGLALYRAGESGSSGDPGWDRKDTNLREQVEELERKGADGYVLFSARYLFSDIAAEELKNLQALR